VEIPSSIITKTLSQYKHKISQREKVELQNQDSLLQTHTKGTTCKSNTNALKKVASKADVKLPQNQS